jgi:23S rRNA (guanosine2251-2'-O)-methyltransferase
VRLETVPAATLSRFAVGVHNGFAAEIAVSRDELAAGSTGDPDLVVLAEDVQDPRNLGALLRVCEGAGVGRVLVREHGSAPVNETVVKASAGAAEWVEVERIGSAAQQIERLRDDGYWIYGLAAEGEPPWAIDLTGKVAICVGGEHEGLRRLTRESCDALIGLPMRGRVESLNLATAAAAVLYEAVRQRSSPE